MLTRNDNLIILINDHQKYKVKCFQYFLKLLLLFIIITKTIIFSYYLPLCTSMLCCKLAFNKNK